MKVDRNQLTEIKTVVYVANAQDLGLAPGEWPEYLTLDSTVSETVDVHELVATTPSGVRRYMSKETGRTIALYSWEKEDAK